MNARRAPAPPAFPRDGLLGTTGSVSGHELLAAVRGWLGSGTLALAQGQQVAGVRVLRGVALMALAAGEVRARHMLGRFAGLAATGLDLHAVIHAPSSLPRLPSAAPGCDLDAARALPRFVSGVHLLPGVSDVKPLLAKLGEVGWHGALLGRSELGSAVALLLEGRVVAVNGRRGQAHLERQEALRLLQRLAHENAPDALQLVPLEPRSAAALAGLALGHTFEGNDQHHTGIAVGPTGFTFVHRGEAYLELAGEHVVAGAPRAAGAHAGDAVAREGADADGAEAEGAGAESAGADGAGLEHAAAEGAGPEGAERVKPPTIRRYAALDEPAAPVVPLPEEPPGWEAQHYVLTLRGRDALNPMTELWMRFRATYVAPGQRLLEVLTDGATLEAVAAALDTPLEELRPWLQRLENEGLVRQGRERGQGGRR